MDSSLYLPAVLLTLLVAIVLFTLAVVYYPPLCLLRAINNRTSPSLRFIFSLPSTEKFIALSFDDSPTPSTPKILDILRAHGVKATFFIIGQYAQEYPDLVKRIKAEGHELANHTQFDRAAWRLGMSELEEDIRFVDGLLVPAISTSTSGFEGEEDEDENLDKSLLTSHNLSSNLETTSPSASCSKTPEWFRPGHGIVTKRMLNMVATRFENKETLLASIFPYDTTFPFAGWNASYVLSRLHPGAIVCLHDGRPWSIKTLETVLQGAEERGYSVGTCGAAWKLSQKYESLD